MQAVGDDSFLLAYVLIRRLKMATLYSSLYNRLKKSHARNRASGGTILHIEDNSKRTARMKISIEYCTK